MDIEEYSKYQQVYAGEPSHVFLKSLTSIPWKSFLDLGCGDGSLLYALNKEHRLDGKTVSAIDLSHIRVDVVKKINKNFNCFVADACNVKQIADGAIDFLASSQVVEHVDNDEDLVKEAYRLLSNDGVFYLATVFKKWYGWYFYRCKEKWVLDPTHLREYTKDSQLLDLLDKYGFEVVINRKKIASRSLISFVLRRLHAKRHMYDSPLVKILGALRFPIPGYYEWELVCRKKTANKAHDRYRVAIVSPATHYYHTPLYKQLTSSANIDLTVYYCSDEAISGGDIKKTYGVVGRFSEDSMLEGYKYQFLKNYSPRPSYLRWPFGLINFGIWNEIKHGNYDAVILQAWTDVTWYVAFLACLKFKTPVMFMTDANIVLEPFRSKIKLLFKKGLLRFLFKRASGFLAAGIANEKFYKYYGADPGKIARFYFSWGYKEFYEHAKGIKSNREAIRKSLGISDIDFLILYVGRLSPEKNPKILLSAFHSLKLVGGKLFFVGDGSLRTEIEQQIQEEKITGVTITGFQNRNNVGNFYAAADVLVLPSSAETWGIVVNEAMCFGLPIIASDQVGAVPDMVKNGYNGFIFPAGNFKGIVSAISKIASFSPQERLIFGQRSDEIIREWIGKIDPNKQLINLLINHDRKQ